MAGKPELSAAPGVQNVLVYVSNDNFAQAYTTVNHHHNHAPSSQQHPPPPSEIIHHHHQHHQQQQQQHQQQQHAQPTANGIPVGYTGQTHNTTLAPKIYADKLHQHQMQLHHHQQPHPHQQVLQNHNPQQFNSQFATNQGQSPYFTNQAVITHQNGFTQAEFDIKDNKYYDVELHQHPHQRTTINLDAIKDEYNTSTPTPPAGYVVLAGAEGNVQRSCDSVRSDAAESSCSSLSSTDDMLIIPNNLPTGGGSGDSGDLHHPGQNNAPAAASVVVYDNGSGGGGGASAVNVRHGVVVAVGGAGTGPHATSAVTVSGAPIIAASSVNQNLLQTSIPIPHGWKRIISNGVVIYISPSNAALSSMEHVKNYLLTPETCKCGLECPLRCDIVFNFDPKVVGKAWTFTPDTNNGDLTKLCNHKRKYIQHLKDCNQLVIKKKKRKVSAPFAAGGVPITQLLSSQREKINPKVGQPVQIFQQHQQLPQFATKENVYQHQQNQPNQQQILAQRYLTSQGQQFFYHNAQQEGAPNPGEPRLNNPSIVAESMILPISAQNPSSNISHQHQQQQQQQQQPPQPLRQIMSANGQNQLLIPAGNLVAAAGSQRVFINGQSSESGPGRPVMIPVSISTSLASSRPEKIQNFIQNGQLYQATTSPQGVRHIVPNGFRPQMHPQPQPQHQIHQPSQQKVWNRVAVQSPSPVSPAVPVNNVFERVPPLHQHQPNQLLQGQVQVQVWPDEVQRKKMKTKVKKQRYIDPSLDVRQMNTNARVVVNQFPNEGSSPSFLEDPSGYLAQQTALLNSTINRQTGANFICNSPQSSSPAQSTPPLQQQPSGVHLPSNMKSTYRQPTQIVKANSFNPAIADSAGTIAPIKCTGCVEYQSAGRSSSSSNSQPGTPDPVTSSNYSEKHSPDSRPIQGGTVSTSNVSPVAVEGDDSTSGTSGSPSHTFMESQPQFIPTVNLPNGRGVVTTMASGRTVGSNTITSVLAGRANTATVSISNPSGLTQQPVSRSPLEMVQSVVSSIKLPNSQNSTISLQSIPQQVVQKGLPPGHILVSSGGQLIMASTNAQTHQNHNNHQQQMPPPPPKLQTSMPPISVSPMVTNVTGSVTQMIPAVAQQVIGQPTVLVNALPGPFVLQPGVTMTMDGINQLQLQPQLVTGNMIHQQQLQPSLLSPEKTKKGKKRKVPTQTVASMLQIAAAQQNSGVVGFPQQIQMHSPQGLTATPVMQALTIVPGKAGSGPQFVMNGQMQNAQIINSQSQPINLLQPVNLAQGMVQNFPTIQQFVLPTNLAGMVMNADGTATILQDANIGMQLQLQNVNGQNVLTPVQTNNQMFTTVQSANGQSLIPSGMVIRPQGKIIQQQHSPGAQFLSPTGGGQFVAQFNGQLSPLVASVSPGQQVTFSSQIRPTSVQQPVQQPEFIQCGQTLMVPANLTAASQATNNQQNTTFVQQNTTIVQQQTTMLSNQNSNNSQSQNQNQTPQHQHQNLQSVHQNMQQNLESYVISSDKQNIQTVLVQQQRQSPLQQNQHSQQQINYRNSVSTQTAVNGHAHSVTTFCQTSTSAGSPPDTTTMSPLASGGQSPPTADTTTHSGSTDDGLSPAPSNCSSSMAMVHCVSSSEPDSASVEMTNQEFDSMMWRNTGGKMEYIDNNAMNISSHLRKTTPPRVAFAESSTTMHFVCDGMKTRENHHVVSTRNFEKPKERRKHSDSMIVMDSHSLFDEDDLDKDSVVPQKKEFIEGDLVWGPAKGCPAWPGKLLAVKGHDLVTVRWFGGGDKILSDVDPKILQTLTEGLDAHHRASKKSRTGRKLNAQLDKAIQEAMVELDRSSNSELENSKVKEGLHENNNETDEEECGANKKIEGKKLSNDKKKTGRLRSGR